eukprot:3513079-Prymnesium_polylepis.1
MACAPGTCPGASCAVCYTQPKAESDEEWEAQSLKRAASAATQSSKRSRHSAARPDAKTSFPSAHAAAAARAWQSGATAANQRKEADARRAAAAAFVFEGVLPDRHGWARKVKERWACQGGAPNNLNSELAAHLEELARRYELNKEGANSTYRAAGFRRAAKL